MDVARRDTVKTIVINAYWESYVGLSKSVSTDNKNALYAVNDSARSIVTNDSSALQDSLGRLTNDLKNLKKQGKRIYIILSNPVDPAFDPRTMINRFNLKTGPDTIAQQDFVQRINPIIQRLREVARKSGAIIIDPVDFMCDGTICPTRMPDGRPAYKDSNHMRTLYAIEKGDFLNVVLEP